MLPCKRFWTSSTAGGPHSLSIPRPTKSASRCCDRRVTMAEPYVYRGGVYRDNAALRDWLASQEPEDVLDPDLPIIDPHHHFWETPKRGRYLLHEFLDDLAAGHNIVQSVFLECEAMYRAGGPEALRPVG